MQLDRGDAQATRGSNKGVPGLMHGRPVPLGIHQPHGPSVAEDYAL
jgi:hypothetical protein